MICTICGSFNFKYLYELPNGSIIKCIECGIVCRERLVSGELAHQLYEDDNYLDSPYFEVLKVGAKTNVEPYLIYNKVLQKLEKTIGKSRLLDIGCAYGAFMETARKKGWNVFGVDISKRSSSYAINQRHLNVYHGTVEKAKYPDNYFSVVTLWDVIEHLDNPLNTLREVNRILEPGGIVVIFTINQKSLINFVGHFLYKLSFNKVSHPLVLLYDIHHNFFFNQSTLIGLLRRAGISENLVVNMMDANSKRWQSVYIPPLLAFGSNCLDLISRVIGQHYRLIIYASKSNQF
ncbi:class I SAM-dependent methyltransferase [bacterium]|nr:class I SAM-dependent methyltransferase [bacterium]